MQPEADNAEGRPTLRWSGPRYVAAVHPRRAIIKFRTSRLANRQGQADLKVTMTTEFVIELGLILLVVFAAALSFFHRLERRDRAR